MTVIRSLIDDVFHELDARAVLIPHQGQVRDYLNKHPGIGDILGPISTRARQEFGDKTELALEVYGDPEIDDQYLTMYVRPQTYDCHIMKRIEGIRDQFREFLADCSGWLLLTTDFLPPGYGNGV